MSNSYLLEKESLVLEHQGSSRKEQKTAGQQVVVVTPPLTTSPNFRQHDVEADTEDDAEEAKMNFLKQLEESVQSAKEEVLRARELLVRAVWYNVLEARPRHERSSAKSMWAKLPPRAPVKDSVPLSVAERRAQLQEQSSLKLLQQRQFEDEVGATEMEITTISQAVSEKPPFIPPNRFPTMPPLNSSDYAHFNYTLYHSVLSAHSQGLLSRKRAGRKGVTGDAPHAGKTSTLRRDAMRHAINAHQRSSTSSSRLERPHEKSFPCLTNKDVATAKLSSTAAQMTPKVDSEEEEVLPCQSVSVIILRIALKRATATLFLRQLRLTTFQRRLFLEEIAMREKFYIERRYLTEWRWRVYVAQRRRQTLLAFCVEAWRAAVVARRRIHDVCTAYCTGLLQRRAARLSCEERRRGRLFRHWMSIFLHKRFMRTLYDTADTFYKGIEEKRNYYVNVFAQPLLRTAAKWPLPRGEAGEQQQQQHDGLVPSISNRLAAKHALDHWRARYAARDVLHAAERRFLQRSAARVLHAFVGRLRKRLTAQLNAPAAGNGPRVVILPSPQSKDKDQPPSALDTVVLKRRFHVHVDACPEELLSYKNACARRIAQGALLQVCFRRWRNRANSQRAQQHWQMRVTTQCMRQWLCRVSRKYQQRETAQAVLGTWRERWAQRRSLRAATYFYFLKTSASVWDRWREAQMARQQHKRRLLAHALHCWYFRAAGAVSVRIADEKQKRSLFSRWKQRASLRRTMEGALLVADTIRETILLIGCVRVWRQRCTERRRCALQASILTELRDEQRCRHCFERWKRRAFGPRQHKPECLDPLTV